MESTDPTQKGFAKFNMIITYSKFMAFILITLAFIIDFANDKNGTVFMFTIPFVVFLITGKQAIDWGKQNVELKKEEVELQLKNKEQ
jgi:uncharacterized metal-binding protein